MAGNCEIQISPISLRRMLSTSVRKSGAENKNAPKPQCRHHGLNAFDRETELTSGNWETQ